MQDNFWVSTRDYTVGLFNKAIKLFIKLFKLLSLIQQKALHKLDYFMYMWVTHAWTLFSELQIVLLIKKKDLSDNLKSFILLLTDNIHWQGPWWLCD